MRSIWACSSCAALLLAALLGQNASASHVGRELNGLACGPNAYCYSTDPVTTTVFETITTTSGEDTLTRTRTVETVVTPTIPTSLDDEGYDALKFIPTSVPKVPATSPSGESKGGLSGGAIGGIITGVVVLMIVVIVAAFLIIRRLKHVANMVENTNRGSSSGRTQNDREQAEKWGRQLHSDADDTTTAYGNHPRAPGSTTSNDHSISGTPTPAGGHTAIHSRSPSAGVPASPPHMYPPYMSPDPGTTGYFDSGPYQQQQQRTRGNTESSVGSAAPYSTHGYSHQRQFSTASELSADGSDGGVASPLLRGGGGGATAELDGTSRAELSGDGVAGGPGPVVHGSEIATATGSSGTRSRSGSAASAWGHARRRSDGVVSLEQGAGGPSGLAPLDETAEMHDQHGHWNPQTGNVSWGATAGYDQQQYQQQYQHHYHPGAPPGSQSGGGS
ncbi:hypothetical protein VTH82DRAFT_8342 [Thermothelomyces myriococcoides]